MVFFACRLLTARRGETRKPQATKLLLRAYTSAALFNTTNPVLILLLLGGVASIFDPSLATRMDMKLLFSGLFLGSISWWICLSGLTAFLSARINSRLLVIIDRMIAIVLFGFGGVAVVRRVVAVFTSAPCGLDGNHTKPHRPTIRRPPPPLPKTTLPTALTTRQAEISQFKKNHHLLRPKGVGSSAVIKRGDIIDLTDLGLALAWRVIAVQGEGLDDQRPSHQRDHLFPAIEFCSHAFPSELAIKRFCGPGVEP